MLETKSQSVADCVRAWKRRVRVYIQGEEDYACGLYCLATAAVYLKTIDTADGSPFDQIFDKLAYGAGLFAERAGHADVSGPPPALARHAELFTAGLWHKDIPAVARACGLKATKTTDVLRSIGADGPVLSYLAVTAVAHPLGRDLPPFPHFVLALQHVPGDGGWIVIADPHPWRLLRGAHANGGRGQVYAVPTESFQNARSNTSLWKKIDKDKRGKLSERAWTLAGLR